MNPSVTKQGRLVLDKVCGALDTLCEVGERYHGLLPSLLDLKTDRMFDTAPPAIAGQRNGDRAVRGCNLMHDQAVLRLMYGLSAALDRPHYAHAADRYLNRFASHCIDTPSGLFPCGEHAYWDVVEDRIGNSMLDAEPQTPRPAVFDHLRKIPLWLWEKLEALKPGCASRFAQGLDWHFKEGQPDEYSRHAFMDASARPPRLESSCDFPRYSGFYLLDTVFAYTRSPSAELEKHLHRFHDYWWNLSRGNGLLPMESRWRQDHYLNVKAPMQTLSLACSLLESAELLTRDPSLAREMRRRAAVYIDGYFSVPHDPDAGIMYLTWSENPEQSWAAPVWGSAYGRWPAGALGTLCLTTYRLTGELRLLSHAKAMGRYYADHGLPRSASHIPVLDAGLCLELLTGLFETTGDKQWLSAACDLTTPILECYFDHRLPRAATQLDRYEAQLGTSFLLHGLARVAPLAGDDSPCPIPLDDSVR